MGEQRLYKSIGLPLDTWRLVDEAKKSLVSLEILGRYPTDSEMVGFLIRHGFARLAQLSTREEERQSEKGLVR